MELSKQIKKYREAQSLSQDELAAKLYVSRQTISNWENEKSYPDVHNLLLLSTYFDVSLDELIKGDVEMMKRKISKTEMDKYTSVMMISLVLSAITLGFPLFFSWWSWWWTLIPFGFWLISMWAAFKIEKMKKLGNIKTYKEIVAFMENQDLEELRKVRDKKRYVIEKVILVLLAALTFLVIFFLAAMPSLFWK